MNGATGTVAHGAGEHIVEHEKSGLAAIGNCNIASVKRPAEAGLKINASKSFFCQEQLEYLGYWITRDGIQPLNKKVEAINNLATPTTRRQLRKFIGMVNYYRDMWLHRSHVLTPLTASTSVTTKWQWTDAHKNRLLTT